jgi:2-haloacid dehalogenase
VGGQDSAGGSALTIGALVFDTYGTLVDWRRSVLAELQSWGAARRLSLDWEQFLTDWKIGYRAGMDKVDSGEWPWTTVDTIYRRRLEEVLRAHGVTDIESDAIEQLNRVWWRLAPWPDTVPGLTRLRARYVISPLSNASFAGMVHLAKFAGLPWDCIITAENARCYKPRPEVYRLAIDLLGCRPQEIMMVAAHNYDLHAARREGMRTAFFPRPTEYGPGQSTDLEPEEPWDIIAKDAEDLARAMGA